MEIQHLELKPGMTLKLKGKIKDDANGFIINLGQSSDELALHFNPRFGENTIVCNSKKGRNWGQEHRDDHLCFKPGSEIKLSLTFNDDEFQVKLPDGHQVTFPNREKYGHLSYLRMEGGISLTSFKLD